MRKRDAAPCVSHLAFGSTHSGESEAATAQTMCDMDGFESKEAKQEYRSEAKSDYRSEARSQAEPGRSDVNVGRSASIQVQLHNTTLLAVLRALSLLHTRVVAAWLVKCLP